MSRRFRLLAAALLALLAGMPLAAQPLPSGPPAEGSTARPGPTVYLLTLGQGDQVWEKFGHNALWVHDPAGGTDRVYHYGLFDFNSPGYWGRFVRGHWIYEMGVDDIREAIFHYQYFNRTVTLQELNLTPAQAAELQGFLEWNIRPENREYRYDYYRDNCSTRIRDALDRVLGGQLRAATREVPTGTTYRWHSRRLIVDDELAYTGLAAGLGPAADRPISAWEEMFLPEKVKEQVGRARVAGADGRPVPLVRSEREVYTAVGRGPEPVEPPFWLPRYLLIGLVLGGLLALLGTLAARSAVARLSFSALAALWSLLMGTGGVVLLGLWMLTDHAIAYRNENLLQFDPLALPLVVLLPALAYGARWAARPALWLSLAVAGLSVLGLLIQPLPGLDQVNGEVIALILPVHLAVAWAAYRMGKRDEGRGKRGGVEVEADGRKAAAIGGRR